MSPELRTAEQVISTERASPRERFERGRLGAILLARFEPLPNGYAAVTWLLSGRLRMGRVID
jgi:hypothetical protein